MSTLTPHTPHTPHTSHTPHTPHTPHIPHAGGSGGPQLFQALSTSRDGTALHWDPSAGAAPSALAAHAGGWEAFRRMAPGPRAAVLDQETACMVRLELSPGAASLHLEPGGPALLTLHAPGAIGADQLDLLRAYADLRMDRLAEIETQQTDVLSFFGALVPMHDDLTRRTAELLAALRRMLLPITMRLKMHFDVPRPIALAEELQPPIQTPGHPAWPSGHATEAFAMAYLLRALKRAGAGLDPEPAHLMGQAAPDVMMRLALRIAQNRTVAGLHYPSDSAAGALLGLAVAEALVATLRAGHVGDRARPARAVALDARAFDGRAFAGDFELDGLPDLGHPTGAATWPERPTGMLDHLWALALEEWRR